MQQLELFSSDEIIYIKFVTGYCKTPIITRPGIVNTANKFENKKKQITTP